MCKKIFKNKQEAFFLAKNILSGTLKLWQNYQTKVDKKNFQTLIKIITRLIQIVLNYQ